LPENTAPTKASASSASINLDDDGGNGYDGDVNAAASDDDAAPGDNGDDDAAPGDNGDDDAASGNDDAASSSDDYGDLSKGFSGGYLNDFWVFRKRPLTRGWGGMDDFMVDITLGNTTCRA
jgi:hypothetical protein